AEKVVIDTDPATGYALRDVDDGLALAYLLALPDEFDVLGITTVFGNVSLPRATARAREAVRVTGRTGVEVFPGAWSRHALGDVSSASMFLPDAVAANPGEVTVLALGPLTNVATAGLADRAFYRDVKRIVVMGGAVDEGIGIPLVSPLEFNFFSDAAAADLVLDAPCEKVVITGDICRQALFTRRELDSLWAMRSRVATYLAYRVRPWLKLNQVLPFLPWKGGFVPWDIVAAVYLRRPDLFSGVEGNGVRLRRGLFRTGTLEPDASRDGRPARLPTRLEPRPLLADFLSAISRY
ncbi:MAG: nucleoside hydrolase, partial [Actinomycetia bacterium]|nr:nucleoside hydrolase [Actinomycetes bacterium]